MRTVVAIDPAVTFTDTSDEFGIVAAGKGPDGRVHILADRSARFASPTRQCLAVVAAAENTTLTRSCTKRTRAPSSSGRRW